MSCYRPIRVMITRKHFHGSGHLSYPQTVGCGSCLGCRAGQARDWTIRLMHERRMHRDAWFITLTYEEVPEHGSLLPQDFSRFVKAVRRDQPPKSVRYFGCGEYGETTQRPHYHAVLFGPSFLDRVPLRSSPSGQIWRSPSLERYWPHGISELGTVTTASAAYVAGYVRKKIKRSAYPDAYTRVVPDTGELVELEPEFSRMSMRPAIGRSWIQKYWTDVYPRDFVVIDGRETRPPRYYDKFMEGDCRPEDPCNDCTAHQRTMLTVREQRYERMIDATERELIAREKTHQARINLFHQRNAV